MFGEVPVVVVYYVVDLSPVKHVTTDIKILSGVIASGMTNLLMGTELTAQQLDYVKIAQASGNTLL